ncbi:MAG: hypothetical protein R3D85_17195 [Paracoccaceae bacterium]
MAETQFGVNFLAPFALTGRLLPLLAAAAARVVTMSSIGHRGAAWISATFGWKSPASHWREYGQSKLADLVFMSNWMRLRAASQCVRWRRIRGQPDRADRRNLGPVPAGVAMMTPAEGAAPSGRGDGPRGRGGQY